MTNFPDNIMTALKESIINVFWKKDDVRSLFTRCEVPSTIIAQQNWQAYKYHIVSPILDYLNSSEAGLGPLRRILQETLRYTDGSHLLWLSDGQKRKREAERCLEHLQLLVKDHTARIETEEEKRQARIKNVQEKKKGSDFKEKLSGINGKFKKCLQNMEAQERGYKLEEILYDLFLLFELNPRSPFKRVGEQIDGSFVQDKDHFLLEAKWQKKPVDLSCLRDLDGAVNSSLDNTLGLFISMNGFSSESLQAYTQGNRPRIICMDGLDLMLVLEATIDFNDLLMRKRDLAVQKRAIFVSGADILQGIV